MDLTGQNIPLRKPCEKCGCEEGVIRTRGGQDCVYCVGCGAYTRWNAPKTATGRAPRTVTSIHNGVKPNQRVRIVLRATGHCELCGKADCELHVGHLLSVKEGMQQGLTETQLNDDENLAAMCAECNLGLGQEAVPIRLILAIFKARLGHARRKGDAA